MKRDFSTGADFPDTPTLSFTVSGETDRLTDVLLCTPSSLAPVPCCSVTRESMRNGFAVSPDAALAQHAALKDALAIHGVRCHTIAADPELPDACFTRDAGVMTPWGFVALNPASPHRMGEVDHMVAAVERTGARIADRITAGTIEGGDICIARHGLLIVGLSQERTNSAGAEAFAARFRREGWDVLLYPFDPHFLHFDTMFSMLDANTALACTDVLDDAFLADIHARGIRLIPTSYKESRGLGCNVLSLDGRTVLMSGSAGGPSRPSVAERVRAAGFTPITLDVSQFAACGGAIHCLTMPLRRVPAASYAR